MWMGIPESLELGGGRTSELGSALRREEVNDVRGGVIFGHARQVNVEDGSSTNSSRDKLTRQDRIKLFSAGKLTRRPVKSV